MENQEFEKTRESKRFDPNVLFFYREPKSSGSPVFKNIVTKRRYLYYNLTHDGLIEWGLQHDISMWQRFTQSRMRKVLGQTDLRQASDLFISCRLKSLLHVELRSSREFANLCNCKFMWALLNAYKAMPKS